MRVCLTIDTEFSIAGALADPARRPVGAPMVECDVDGRSQGLGFLLDCFARHDVCATFFIETRHRQYFHDDPMRPLVRRIAAAGHELQLHVHPCWDVFRHTDWRARVCRQPRQDDFAGRDEASTLALLRDGQASFTDWDLAPPQVFRSGSLQHDHALYRALASAAIPYSSNIGLGIYNSGVPAHQLRAGRHLLHGVLENPVLSFSDWRWGRPHLKTLTICGTSYAQTITLLELAWRAGLEQVVILTHPFEYVQSRGVDFRLLRRHAVNQARLTRLCAWLAPRGDRFQSTGLAASASQPLTATSAGNPLLRAPGWQSVCRIATQIAYERYGELALARLARRAT
jgi:hypothetical protein